MVLKLFCHFLSSELLTVFVFRMWERTRNVLETSCVMLYFCLKLKLEQASFKPYHQKSSGTCIAYIDCFILADMNRPTITAIHLHCIQLQFFLSQFPVTLLSVSLGQACRTSCNVKHLDLVIWITFSCLLKAIYLFYESMLELWTYRTWCTVKTGNLNVITVTGFDKLQPDGCHCAYSWMVTDGSLWMASSSNYVKVLWSQTQWVPVCFCPYSWKKNTLLYFRWPITLPIRISSLKPPFPEVLKAEHFEWNFLYLLRILKCTLCSLRFVQYLFFFKKWLVKQVQYLCFICFPFMFVVSWYFYAVKRVSRNEGPVYNISLLGTECLTWDGWLCNCPVGIDQVAVWWGVVAYDVSYADDICFCGFVLGEHFPWNSNICYCRYYRYHHGYHISFSPTPWHLELAMLLPTAGD